MARAPNGSGKKFILAHVNHAGDECLLWPYSLCTSGYPSCMIDRKVSLAHRYMCRLAHGEPPAPQYHAAHSCGNRRCINPRHLSWKTGSENQMDRPGQGRPFTGRRQQFTPEQVREIRGLKGRTTVIALTEQFGTTESNIRQIQHGKTYRSISGS